MAHEYHGLGAVLKAVLDSWQGADDAFCVSNLTLLEGHVEVHAH